MTIRELLANAEAYHKHNDPDLILLRAIVDRLEPEAETHKPHPRGCEGRCGGCGARSCDGYCTPTEWPAKAEPAPAPLPEIDREALGNEARSVYQKTNEGVLETWRAVGERLYRMGWEARDKASEKLPERKVNGNVWIPWRHSVSDLATDIKADLDLTSVETAELIRELGGAGNAVLVDSLQAERDAAVRQRDEALAKLREFEDL
jgi:hypothetical protein